MTTLGSVALYLVFGLTAYAAVAGVLAGRRGDRRLMRSSRNAFWAALAATLVAVVAVEYALATHDFSLSVVADHTSRRLPTGYTLSSLWASEAGSLLLWLAILTGASALALHQNRKRNRELMPWVAAVLGGIAAFFSGLAAFVSSPFEHVSGTVPPDGAGLDPSLQNPYMVAHPPMLYLGYVTLSIPFAFAMAALVTGRTDARWLVSVRRWTLVSWAALGTGMLLGAHWAYTEIGWGGYWAWDPVENAALMPWLAATAFLHSVIVQEKKGMLKVWNMVLVSAAFSLAVFGDFLTRSGVVQSVHSFVQSPVGPYLLAFVATVLAVSTALIIWRLPLLRAEHRLESVVSREATFLFNNLLLLALAFAVLWGVVFPILSEAVRGVRSTVSTPYYDFFLVIFGLPLLALTGIGPLIAWRRASPDSLVRTFRWPVISALAGAALLYLLGLGSSTAGLTALSLCVFVTVTVCLEFARGTAARRALAGGSIPRAFVDLIGRNRRRYGGYVVHLAIVILVVGGYTLRNTGVFQRKGPNYTFEFVRLAVTRGGSSHGVLEPGQRVYDTGQIGNEVDIRSSLPSGTDLYSILQGVDRDGAGGVTVKVLVNPAVGLVWLAGAVFLLGALITLWPDPREARQLARRYGELLARSGA
jgi:cytochrome c-type biogenesis protein CcmF